MSAKRYTLRADHVHAIAVDENAAVLVEPDGSARIVGGPAYFLESTKKPRVYRRKVPLDFREISAHRAAASASFDLKKWKGDSADDYTLSVVEGKVQVIGSTHGVY